MDTVKYTYLDKKAQVYRSGNPFNRENPKQLYLPSLSVIELSSLTFKVSKGQQITNQAIDLGPPRRKTCSIHNSKISSADNPHYSYWTPETENKNYKIFCLIPWEASSIAHTPVFSISESILSQVRRSIAIRKVWRT